MGEAKSESLFNLAEAERPSISLEERETNEIIVAFVGPVGSGVSKTAETASKALKDVFNYDVESIKVSDLIAAAASHVDIEIDAATSEKKRVSSLQDAGTRLREKFGENYLSEKCIDHIATHRVEHDGYTDVDGTLVAEPRRWAYLIDSVKHPSEIALLRDVYGGVLWVFGIFAPEDIRKSRLEGKGVSIPDIDVIFEVDEDEEVDHGQKVDTLGKDVNNRLRQSYDPFLENVSKYWSIYGGVWAILSSPFFHAAIVVGIISTPFWSAEKWWETILGIVPDTIGFTIGGYAILVAFGDEDFRKRIAGKRHQKDEESPFMDVSASLLHSVILQATCMLLALVANSIFFLSPAGLGDSASWVWYLPAGLFSFIGYTTFLYALFTIVAVGLNIFRVSRWFDYAQTERKKKN